MLSMSIFVYPLLKSSFEDQIDAGGNGMRMRMRIMCNISSTTHLVNEPHPFIVAASHACVIAAWHDIMMIELS